MKKISIIIGILIVIAGIGYYGWGYFKGRNGNSREVQKKVKEKAKGRAEEAPIPVKVTEAVLGDLPLRLSFSGQADCWDKATVKAEASGKIVKIFKTIGERVNKGEVVIKIDDEDEKISYEQAKAVHLKALADYITTFRTIKIKGIGMSNKDRERVKKARAQYEKSLSFFREGKLSQEKLKDAEEKLLIVMIEAGALKEEVRRATKGLTDAELNFRKAELALERTEVKAPFSGVVSEIKISTGETVSPGSELFRIVNPASLYIRAYVLESELGKLKEGMEARVKFLAFPDKYFRGRIKAISPELDPEKKTAVVYIQLSKNSPLLRPGMSCDVGIEYKILKNVVKVPRKAIIVRSQRPLVFVVQNGIALWRYIELGAQNDTEAEIKSGVSAGEDVVVEGQLTLAHQSKVKILK